MRQLAKWSRFWILGWLLGVVFSYGWAAQQDERTAQRYFYSGQALYERGHYEQAVRDWQFIVDRLPNSPYADDALVAIGRYYLERKRDPDQALALFQKVIQQYPDTDQLAAAYYFIGYVQFFFPREGFQDLQKALANFERVAILYPHSPWAGQALVQAGTILWLTGRPVRARALCRRALEQFGEPILAEAGLCIARSYAYEGRWNDAMAHLAEFQALSLNALEWRTLQAAATTLYRHAIRFRQGPVPYFRDPQFQLSREIQWDQPRWLLRWSGGWAVVDIDLRWVIFYDPRGRYVRRRDFSRLRYASIGYDDTLYGMDAHRLFLPDGRVLELRWRGKKVKSSTFALDRRGTVWVHLRGSREILGFVMDYTALKERRLSSNVFKGVRVLSSRTPGRPTRIQMDPWQRLWILANTEPQIRVLTLDGREMARWSLQTPWHPKGLDAVGWDILGFVYALDAEGKQIGILSPSGRHVFTVDLKTLMPGAEPIDLLVLEDGSLYVLDQKSKQVFRLI